VRDLVSEQQMGPVMVSIGLRPPDSPPGGPTGGPARSS
jgi:hypothetical protein